MSANNIINFYNLIDYTLDNDVYSYVFKFKSGNSVKICDLHKHIDVINLLSGGVKSFILKHKKVYVVPIDLPDGTIVAFVFKSYNTKDFFKYQIDKRYPIVYGLYDFNDYVINYPIILVEGFKDCEVVKRLYKYCIAYLSSAPSDMLLDFLKSVTNKIIFFPDSDYAGKQLQYDKRLLVYRKYYVPFGKDLGIFWTADNVTKYQLLTWLKRIFEIENIDVRSVHGRVSR